MFAHEAGEPLRLVPSRVRARASAVPRNGNGGDRDVSSPVVPEWHTRLISFDAHGEPTKAVLRPCLSSGGGRPRHGAHSPEAGAGSGLTAGAGRVCIPGPPFPIQCSST